MTLEESLSSLRKKQGLSQQELAEKIGVARQTISKWESGAATPSTENISCLAQLYGVSVDCLLNGEQTEPLLPAQTLPTAQVSAAKKKRYLWLLAVGLFAAGVLVGMLIAGAGKQVKHIENMPGEVVSAQPDGTFHIGW